jgi:ATP-dependent RNA circularization protein (DNA/RNA ligase family)
MYGENGGVKDDFFKFPSTPHLATMPGVDIRGDKVLSKSKRDEFLRHELVVEEKVDGANLGISFDSEGNIRAQNRGEYLHLPGSGQWKKLGDWLAPRTDTLFEHLSDNSILFGEWCYAQHSVFYDWLPDWFLGFDVYDKRFGRFLSSERRDALLREMGIAHVPVLERGRFAYPEIQKLLSTSKLSDQPAEGIYLRFDQDDWLAQRAKLVRPAFIQAVEQHWSRSAIRRNGLRLDVHG